MYVQCEHVKACALSAVVLKVSLILPTLLRMYFLPLLGPVEDPNFVLYSELLQYVRLLFSAHLESIQCWLERLMPQFCDGSVCFLISAIVFCVLRLFSSSSLNASRCRPTYCRAKFMKEIILSTESMKDCPGAHLRDVQRWCAWRGVILLGWRSRGRWNRPPVDCM